MPMSVLVQQEILHFPSHWINNNEAMNSSVSDKTNVLPESYELFFDDISVGMAIHSFGMSHMVLSYELFL
jgi:hypothetical protein